MMEIRDHCGQESLATKKDIDDLKQMIIDSAEFQRQTNHGSSIETKLDYLGKTFLWFFITIILFMLPKMIDSILLIFK